MKYINTIVVLILSFVIPSCETEVDASSLLDTNQLIIINGYLSPQNELLKIHISKSRSRYDQPQELEVKNAVVSIKNERQTEVFLSYNSNTFNYEIASSKFVIEAGKQYFLTAVVDGNNYTSSCKIPLNKTANLQEEITIEEVGLYTNTYNLNIEFDDSIDSKNFYIIGAEMIYSARDTTAVSNHLLNDINQFVTDTNRNGATISTKNEIKKRFTEGDTLKIQITNVEKLLYEALRSGYLNSIDDVNPFIDPIILPTNIEGKNGYGIFAGYQLTEKKVRYAVPK